MEVTRSDEREQPFHQSDYDRMAELKAFDNTKAGVKGITEANPTKIPKIFICENLDLGRTIGYVSSNDTIPIISIKDIDKDSPARAEVVNKIKVACEKGGFFQITNHGVPETILNELIKGIQGFHEMDTELKKKYYTRDFSSEKVFFVSNYDLYSTDAAGWRDTLACFLSPSPPDPEDFPEICKNIILNYCNKIEELGMFLLELISEALGRNPDYFETMGCAVGKFVGHYYPPCPEPELTMGIYEHSDAFILSIVLQDKEGLQVKLGSEWFNVDPTPGALVVNVGDMLQRMSNNKFISSKHRVLANNIGPRTSSACFFMLPEEPNTKRE